jgi:hypothetical protein
MITNKKWRSAPSWRWRARADQQRISGACFVVSIPPRSWGPGSWHHCLCRLASNSHLARAQCLHHPFSKAKKEPAHKNIALNVNHFTLPEVLPFEQVQPVKAKNSMDSSDFVTVATGSRGLQQHQQHQNRHQRQQFVDIGVALIMGMAIGMFLLGLYVVWCHHCRRRASVQHPVASSITALSSRKTLWSTPAQRAAMNQQPKNKGEESEHESTVIKVMTDEDDSTTTTESAFPIEYHLHDASFLSALTDDEESSGV